MHRVYRQGGAWYLEGSDGWRQPAPATVAALWSGAMPVADFLKQPHPACAAPAGDRFDAPVLDHELWAAGVTYSRSRAARISESTTASVYDRVYDAPRPQIFFKGAPGKAVGHGGAVAVRHDSKWTVPEPELVLVADAAGRLVGFTLGDDVTARDIEGVNPLYQPQAKSYQGSCALGPCVVLAVPGIDPLAWTMSMTIERGGAVLFTGSTEFSRIKRPLAELVGTLYACQSFPGGTVLLTGTDVVPPDEVALEAGDVVRIACPAVGELVTEVRRHASPA